MYQQILYSVEDPIATITFNRPERLNAMTPKMEGELKHAIGRAEADSAVVAIVVTGAGRGFCAGADLKNLEGIAEGKGFGEASALVADPGDPAMEGFRGPYSYMFSVRKPIVAALNGPTAGLGLAAALFADVRFASDRATFTTAFSRRGLIAEWGMSWTLPRLVGAAHALDVLWSGRVFDAAEAERIGLVNRVLPHDELLPFVRNWAEELAKHASPASIAVMKRQVYESATSELDPALRESIRLMQESFTRPDFKEGVSSFLEKRPPKFARITS
jgi:enoyl-CoA hydratase/carnithine racemase